MAYATYGYNALEQLVSRSTTAPGGPSGTIHYIYDFDGHLIAEADGATGAPLREYIWLDDLPIGLVQGGTLYMVHSDHLARPIRVTNAARATVWQASYKPFGEVQAISGSLALDLRFPGQLFQIETGLHYNWHRHYDPVTGRYTQPDPLRFVDGPSVYAYAGSSPFVYSDEDGRYVDAMGNYYPDGDPSDDAGYDYNPWEHPYITGAMMVAPVAVAVGGEAAAATLAAQACRAVSAEGILFKRGGGLLNNNPYLRIGWSWSGSAKNGSLVFRIAVGSKKQPIHWHWDLWK